MQCSVCKEKDGYFRVAESGRHGGEEHGDSRQDSSPDQVAAVVHSLGEKLDEVRSFFICAPPHDD